MIQTSEDEYQGSFLGRVRPDLDSETVKRIEALAAWEPWTFDTPQINTAAAKLIERINDNKFTPQDVETFFNQVQVWLPASHALAILFFFVKIAPTELIAITKLNHEKNSEDVPAKIFLSRLSVIANTEFGDFISTTTIN